MNRAIVWSSFLWVVVTWGLPSSGIGAESAAGAGKITKEARETIETTRQYTVQQKEAFEQKAHEELVAIQQQINLLRGKVHDTSSRTRTEFQKSIQELEKKKVAATRKLDELRVATDAKWNELKNGATSALAELKHSYEKAKSQLP